MKTIYQKYGLRLVKEQEYSYDASERITSPSLVEKFCKDVLELHLQTEEVIIALAFDTQRRVNGIFEVSRGVLDASNITPRELFKRLFMVNAAAFIVVHNHPGGSIKPSEDDRNAAEMLYEVSKMFGIEMSDFCIIGEGIYSFRQSEWH